MKLICLGSSSRGNCYILQGERESLIIECGIRIKDIKIALNFSLRNVVGCLVSHEHKDHSLSVNDMLECGIKVLALDSVFSSVKSANRVFTKIIEPMHGYKVGGFKVFAFPLAHDVPCVGYIIEHDEMGKLLFATDTMMIEYNFSGLNHIMIEANYCDNILQTNIESGLVPVSMRRRLMHSHLELNTTKNYLKATDMSNVNEVILLHLSHDNGDVNTFISEIAKVSGKPTYIARSGFIVELNKEPF